MSGIVVIGAGQAGATLVEKLRANGYEGKITLIGEEPHLPYQRPPLSKKYLLGEMEQERLRRSTARQKPSPCQTAQRFPTTNWR